MSSSISEMLKHAIRRGFPRLVQLRNRLYNHLAHYRLRNRPIAEVFTLLYHENHWNGSESRSGPGSSVVNTTTVIEIIEKILVECRVKTMLDIPCGDFNWMKNVNMDNTIYHGGDIVTEIIEIKQTKFRDARRSFSRIDVTSDRLPKVDLIFCRDCLVHFSFADIRKALLAFRDSGSTYLMTTTFPGHNNFDIITGNWRPINLQASPFNFPDPVSIRSEERDESGRGEYPEKSLALWRIDQLFAG